MNDAYKKIMAQKRKKVKNTRMPGTSGVENFRWTPEDIANDVPGRLRKILDLNGMEFSGLTRSLLCNFIELLEDNDGKLPAIAVSVQRVARTHAGKYSLNEPPAKYGGKKKAPSKRR